MLRRYGRLRRVKSLNSDRRRQRQTTDQLTSGTLVTTQTFTKTLNIGSNAMIKADGFDDCILGIAEVWDGNERIHRIVYDALQMVDVLMERDGMSHEEAIEYFEFNIDGAYVGKSTPVFMFRSDLETIEELAEHLDD